jgi:UDP-N-acetylmuramoyl-tripeptide--D-alanyl-D-alanine ligase
LKGDRFDAHDFLKDVIGREPAAVLVHTEPAAELLALAKQNNVAAILVDETIAALNRLAAAYRANELGGGFRAKVVAVGGSNGKTTTKRIIHTLLKEKFGGTGGIASPASFNNNIGMPLTLLDVSPAHEYVILEIGTNAPGEIDALGKVCKPDVALITSIGLEHLEKLVDLAGVAREEAAISTHISASGMLILPGDVPELVDSLKGTKARKFVVARPPLTGADLLLTDVRETAEGIAFSINSRGQFLVPLLGEHNAMNALMAIAVARRFGLSDEQIAAGLAKVKPVEGRMERMKIGEWTIIHDAYNANPTSMSAALKTFAKLDKETSPQRASDGNPKLSRSIAVLADMLELGSSSQAMHREIGLLAGSLDLDMLILIGPAMKHAAEAARGGTAKVVWFDSTPAARDALLPLLRPDDTILLKGSHGMHLETLLETLRSGMDMSMVPPGVPAAMNG